MAYPNDIPDRIFGTDIDGSGIIGHIQHRKGGHGPIYRARTGRWDAAYLADVTTTMRQWTADHPHARQP